MFVNGSIEYAYLSWLADAWSEEIRNKSKIMRTKQTNHLIPL